MVALKQVKVPYCTSISQQRGWRSGALAQVSGRTAFPILLKNIVLTAKRQDADLLELHAPEFL